MGREIYFATTDTGLELPVVDLTHPAFAVTLSDSDLAAMTQQFLEQRQPEMTAEVREAFAGSLIGKGLMAASGSFLDAITTYLLKLGPEHLGPRATVLDRRIAESLPSLLVRIRLQDIARLLADGLTGPLANNQDRPVCFINIAGGPGADSWNAILYLADECPGLLSRRRIALVVLDLDPVGPAFGRRAFAALTGEGAPLNTLDTRFEFIPYRWSNTGVLEDFLVEFEAANAVCAISSEGGLFDYGSDEEIVANLKVLHAGTAEDAIVAASVTRRGVATSSQAACLIAVRPRTIDEVRCLATQGRWTVERAIERPISYQVLLAKG